MAGDGGRQGKRIEQSSSTVVSALGEGRYRHHQPQPQQKAIEAELLIGFDEGRHTQVYTKQILFQNFQTALLAGLT